MVIPFDGALRRKDSREAADAGLLLWRENLAVFLPFFAIPLWICAFALRLIPGMAPYWSWIIIWLLKPLFDRPVLHIISVRFFESGAGMKRLYRDLGKSLLRGLPGDLLWRRFSPLRAAMMPVRVLEPAVKFGRKKRLIAERRKNLKNGGIGFCFYLTFWGIALEITLLIGEILFFLIMTDLFKRGFISYMESSLENMEIYVFAAWCFNYMLVETIYVCMGFSLYINSRIEVEGWDIEILFRSLAEKLKNKSINAALILVCLAMLFIPVKTFAADWEPAAAGEDIPIEKLQSILDSPGFGSERDSWGIRLRNPVQQEAVNLDLQRIFAYALQFILIGLVAGLLVLLFFYLRKFRRSKSGAAYSSAVKSLDDIPEENPQSLLEKALSFNEQGKLRLAWGYCTAAVIRSWPLYRGFTFPPNATENDCANIVSSSADGGSAVPEKPPRSTIDEAQAFSGMIKHWVYLAYAGRLPPEGSFEKAVALCKSLRTANG